MKIIKKLLVSYFKSQRKELELDEKFPALFPDAFWGQMILEVTLLLAEKKTLFAKVPLMQALNLLVNDWVKQWMHQWFADWYAEQI